MFMTNYDDGQICCPQVGGLNNIVVTCYILQAKSMDYILWRKLEIWKFPNFREVHRPYRDTAELIFHADRHGYRQHFTIFNTSKILGLFDNFIITKQLPTKEEAS